MKKLIILIFTLMFSFNSYGEWTVVDVNDKTTYIDLNSIKNHNEFIYWWNMVELKEEKSEVTGSSKVYIQGDCGISRTRILSIIIYSKPMGVEELGRETTENSEWSYNAPDSLAGTMLNIACRYADASDNEKETILEEIQSKEEVQEFIRIAEKKAIDNENLILELELKLLELTKLVQEKTQEIYEFDELRASYQKEEALLDLKDIKNLVREENQKLVNLRDLIKTSEQEAKDKAEYTQSLLNGALAKEELVLKQLVKAQLETLKSTYVNNIAAKIKTYWRYQAAEDDWTAEVYVVQDRDGRVVAVDVRNANVGNSSLGKSFKDSIERAVNKASPLPVAPDDAVFNRELYLIFSVN